MMETNICFAKMLDFLLSFVRNFGPKILLKLLQFPVLRGGELLHWQAPADMWHVNHVTGIMVWPQGTSSGAKISTDLEAVWETWGIKGVRPKILLIDDQWISLAFFQVKLWPNVSNVSQVFLRFIACSEAMVNVTANLLGVATLEPWRQIDKDLIWDLEMLPAMWGMKLIFMRIQLDYIYKYVWYIIMIIYDND